MTVFRNPLHAGSVGTAATPFLIAGLGIHDDLFAGIAFD